MQKEEEEANTPTIETGGKVETKESKGGAAAASTKGVHLNARKSGSL